MGTLMLEQILSIMNAGGLRNVYFTVWNKLKSYGYGTDKVKVYPSYAPSGCVKANADVRISEYHHADGSKVFAVSSFGYAGNVKLEFADKFSKAVDFENGKNIAVDNDGSVSLNFKKHDFKIIKVSK